MTTPTNKLQSTVSSLTPDELLCSASQPKAVYDEGQKVCSIDSYVSSSTPDLLESAVPSFRSFFHQQYAEQVFLRNRENLVAQGLGKAQPKSKAESNSFNPLELLFGLIPIGCSSVSQPDDAPPTIVSNPPTDDNPPVKPGRDDGGLGTGINASFGKSDCQNPLDLDAASAAGSLLMTCGTQPLGGVVTGVGLVEQLNASTGDVSKLQLPVTFNGKPIRLMSSSDSQGGIFYTGFEAAGSKAEFEGGNSDFSKSGIFSVSESSPSAATATSFDAFQLSLFGNVQEIALAGIDGTIEASVKQFSPNSPRSMVRVGDSLFVLNANQVLNPNVVAYNKANGQSKSPIDYAPATIHRFKIGTSGALTPEAIGDIQKGNVIAGTTRSNNAYLLDGDFNPTAIAAVGSDRIAAVIQGIPGSNASKIHVFNVDMTSGLNAGPDSAGGSEIPLTDASDPKAPDFRVNDSSQLAIAGGRYALVGSADGSGRIAVVDLNKDEPALGTSRVHFVKIFDDGSDIANIVIRPDGKFAYVIGTSGKIRAVSLANDDNFGKVGKEYTITPEVPSDGIMPAAYSANSVIVARPNMYSKAPITQ